MLDDMPDAGAFVVLIHDDAAAGHLTRAARDFMDAPEPQTGSRLGLRGLAAPVIRGAARQG